MGPRSRTGARACLALARHRTPGARALGYLGPGGVPFFQVTRRKGETISGRYRSNGYVLSQAAIAGKPAPTVDRVHPRDNDQVRIPRPLTSNRAHPRYRITVATNMNVIAILIRISETPRMP